jgi:hypothetical protein
MKNENATTIGAPLNRIDSEDPHEVVHTNLVKGGPKVKNTLAELYAVSIYDRDWGMPGTVLDDGPNSGKWTLTYDHVDTDLANNANWKKDAVELVFDEVPTAGSPNLVNSGNLKTWGDNLIEGIDRKRSARMATTANIILDGLQTIDGVVGVAEDDVVVKNQTDATQNGIWTIKAGAWVRRSDANSATELENAYVTVREGALNIGVTYRQLTKPVTLGMSNIVWDVAGAIISPAAENVPGITEYADQTEAETALDPVLANRRHDRAATPKGVGWILDKFKTVSQTFAEIVGFTKGIILGTNAVPVDGAVWVEGGALKMRAGGATKTLLADVNNLSELIDRNAARKNLGFRTTPTDLIFGTTVTWSFLEGLVPEIYDMRKLPGVNADFTLNITDTASGASGIVRIIKTVLTEVKMYLGDLGGTITHLADDTTPLPFVILPANETRIFGYFSQWDSEFQWYTSDGKALPAEGYSNSDWMTQAAVTNGLKNRPMFGGELYGADVDIGNNSNFQFILKAFNRQVLFLQQYGIQIVGGDNAATNNILSTSLDGTVLLRLLNDRNLGLGPSLTSSFGGGKGVLFFANALTVPAGNPTSGLWMWIEGGLLKIKNSSGIIQTSHVWPDTLPANSGIGNPAGTSAAPIPMFFRNQFIADHLGYGYQEDGNIERFGGKQFTQTADVTVTSIDGATAFLPIIGAGVGSMMRVGGTLPVARMPRIINMGKLSFVNTTDTLEIAITLNGTTIITTGPNTGLALTNVGYTLEFMGCVRAVGAGTNGKMSCHLKFTFMNIDTGSFIAGDQVYNLADFDSTLDMLFGVAIKYIATSTSNNLVSTDTSFIIW